MCNQNNYGKPPAKRKANVFRCQVCNESFSSASTLRSHESSHLSYARVTRSNISNRILYQDPNSIGPVLIHPGSVSATVEDTSMAMSTAVGAVKAIIAEKKVKGAGKGDRGKRGEYRRYSIEMRETIAQYAQRHGNHEASRVFTASLGNKYYHYVLY